MLLATASPILRWVRLATAVRAECMEIGRVMHMDFVSAGIGLLGDLYLVIRDTSFLSSILKIN